MQTDTTDMETDIETATGRATVQVRHNQLGLQCNDQMLSFLNQQLEKVKDLQRPAIAKAEEWQAFKETVEKGYRLLNEHASTFSIQTFRKIDDVWCAVHDICGFLKAQTQVWGVPISSQLEGTVPVDCIDDDRKYLHKMLSYILKGTQRGIDDELLLRWLPIKRTHDEDMKFLRIVSENSLVVKGQIGEGRYGLMYEAVWNFARVAVEKPPMDDLPMEEFASLVKEVLVQAKLSHPNIAQVHGTTPSGWLVMEMADIDLRALCHGAWKVGWPGTLNLLTQAAAGLCYLHCLSPRLVHSDVKSSSFLIFGRDPCNCKVKITDFGHAFVAATGMSRMVRVGEGPLEWMAPELFEGQPTSASSDVYGFGVVMYEVVTRAHPYGVDKMVHAGGKGATVMMMKLSNEEPCKVQPEDCPEELRLLMRRCCSFNPAERPTMTEVTWCLRNLPAAWRPSCQHSKEQLGSSFRNLSEEPVAAVPQEDDSDERHNHVRIDEVQQQLMGLRYNSHIMHFLKEQMEKAQGLAQLESLPEGASQQLDAALKQGDRLINKHLQVFDVRRFYKIEDAVEAVRLVCGKMREAFVEHRSQIAFEAPQQCVDRDRQHLYAHLGYVLMGSHCDFAGEDGFRQEWESLRRWHEVRMRDLNVIIDSDLAMGRRRGCGGYSQVYEGQWRRVNVAVKKMTAIDDAVQLPLEEFAEVFKEASMLASLNHPHIIRYYGITKSGWMVMELADGDLSSLRADTKFTWLMILDILEQAASALEFVHHRHDPLVHGDIKDKNFLYKKLGNGKYDVKLADFGVTTEVCNWQTNTIRKATATPLWKAPELYEDENPSLGSDVFSFGLVMYALVTGLVPYGFGTNELAVMRKKLKREPPCPVRRCDCPGEMCDLMERCVAMDPADRPTMSEVAECLSKMPRDWQPGQ